MKYILLDIEGTTTSIDFVHRVLFPYSTTHLVAYLKKNADVPVVEKLLDDVRHTILDETKRTIAREDCAEVLLKWIREDRKHPALKLLQGYLWQQGYESGELKGHVYPDVPLAFERWKRQGLGLGIYSSGSKLAQILIFGHTPYGDLNRFLDNNFDTEVGPKRESRSYEAIAQQLKLPPADILFLSDVAEELHAARKAGFQVAQLMREGAKPSDPKLPWFTDFSPL